MIDVFFQLWTPLEKNRRPRRRGLSPALRACSRLEPTLAYSPQRPVAFAFGELLPQPLCGRLFQIWDDIIGYFNSSSAAPKRLRQQLASERREFTRAMSKARRDLRHERERRAAQPSGCVCVVCVFSSCDRDGKISFEKCGQ